MSIFFSFGMNYIFLGIVISSFCINDFMAYTDRHCFKSGSIIFIDLSCSHFVLCHVVLLAVALIALPCSD